MRGPHYCTGSNTMRTPTVLSSFLSALYDPCAGTRGGTVANGRHSPVIRPRIIVKTCCSMSHDVKDRAPTTPERYQLEQAHTDRTGTCRADEMVQFYQVSRVLNKGTRPKRTKRTALPGRHKTWPGLPGEENKTKLVPEHWRYPMMPPEYGDTLCTLQFPHKFLCGKRRTVSVVGRRKIFTVYCSIFRTFPFALGKVFKITSIGHQLR